MGKNNIIPVHAIPEKIISAGNMSKKLYRLQATTIEKHSKHFTNWLVKAMVSFNYSIGQYLQYPGKNEAVFHLRLWNHRKAKNAFLAYTHFETSKHKFQRDSKFKLIEKITKQATTKQLRFILGNEKTFKKKCHKSIKKSLKILQIIKTYGYSDKIKEEA